MPDMVASRSTNTTRGDKAATKARLLQMHATLLGAGRHPSISEVARAVGLDPSTIHKVYPDVALVIGQAVPKRSEERALTASLEDRARSLENEKLTLKRDLKALATRNQVLADALRRLGQDPNEL